MNPADRIEGAQSTISRAEVDHFGELARQWWDSEGDFKALHRINPARIRYIRDQLCLRFGRDAASPDPLSGLKVVDIGCGGGLITEPLARLGADAMGIDASPDAIEIARAHADTTGLAVAYENAAPEDLAARTQEFDAVISMEVIEHTDDPGAFINVSAKLIRPGGVFVGATLNRTLKSLALGKFAAEYVLGWVPPGTHDWSKFVRPSEFAGYLRRAGLDVLDLKGLSYAPLDNSWTLSGDLGVNYMLTAAKPGAA
ncbi:MAG: bifunctional 2-polyprenyl-6-hydroxyphenol methylase/3-demethylubiquinol 3-O-methyltransferase UbiG [Rhodospirillales bacterium]|jgi:2-polyprenyl-6-hydroxyphenyl methylase/3-demethylubiquinone-9 3-methyltransferase|nr:bifunctional 3-demethylubiquinol 3-O-methyltransferase/2-polyprenyl-6-hydroxyphenol methylase [Rhodospirillaceae bacterium]MDP6426935.1 bifunctional 2-polyprenyl-6-hydroxyphenol methylase/3-demethylubiquinol 3-O-methyltransferase UbiG [Rhodospirillales bacterium]MDP6645363.1 bifunctional 2-polyprenyl-6-hydroxyphenol methylase/3-demethylubiquinol 3-O-methyltransferase UbiG [Rhodospirillales bacterium]MDP6842613.1 bifunctional 2-polyprenyl-6-hydroxyphenol methylase/3-demethylubiquinol 3-O-methy